MTLRLAIITDAHGNLPALQAALAAIDAAGVDVLVHTGDAIGIGPYPRECLEVLTARRATHCLLGNHDAWYAFGLPTPRPAWMGAGEWAHQQWTHATIGPDLRATVAAWPPRLQLDSAAGPIDLLHFPRHENGEFLMPSLAPTNSEAAHALFQSDARVVFYGHHHQPSDLQSATCRYVNPGALGCAPQPLARIAFLTIEDDGQHELTLVAIPYDATALMQEFDRRAVPERDLIRRIFMPYS